MNLRVKIFVLLSLTFFLVECRSADVARGRASRPPKDFQALKAEDLVSAGDSKKARYSRDGQKLIFISGQRSSHKQAQAYELNSTNMKERRLTFHDGDVDDAIFAKDDGFFFYASSTDEIKEDPDFIREHRSVEKPKTYSDPLGRTLPRTEIYFSNRAGSEIRRLTRSPEYDGALSLSSDGKTLFFASVRSGHFKTYSLKDLNSSAQIFSRGTGDAEFFVAPSEKRWAVVTGSKDSTSSRLEVISTTGGGKPLPLTTLNHHSLHPAWHPNGEWILFSSNSEDPLNFELYVVRRDGECLTRLTYTTQSEVEPAFHPSSPQNEFVFTLKDSTQTTSPSKIQRVKEWSLPSCDKEMKKEFK